MTHLDWHQTGEALFANTADREYIICRRILARGIKYVAWCNMRGCFFAEQGPFKLDDLESRKAAIASLKQACVDDAEQGGFGKWNA